MRMRCFGSVEIGSPRKRFLCHFKNRTVCFDVPAVFETIAYPCGISRTAMISLIGLPSL